MTIAWEQRAAVRTIHLHEPWQAVPLLGLQAAGVPVSTDVVQVAPKTQIKKYCVDKSENCHWVTLAIQ